MWQQVSNTGLCSKSTDTFGSLLLSDQTFYPSTHCFSCSVRSKGFLLDIHLGKWCSDLWAGSSVSRGEESVSVQNCWAKTANQWTVTPFLCISSWTEVLKSTIEELKKSGPSSMLSVPPGGGGGPLSPTTYVFLCLLFILLCVCCVENATVWSLLTKVHHLIKLTFLLLFPPPPPISLTAPLIPIENGSLKSSSGERTTLNKLYRYDFTAHF